MEKKFQFKLSNRDSFENVDAESMFRDLKDRSVQHLWSHQADILRSFHEVEKKEKDIAIELPTGCGKTLIGLVLAEWRRKKFKEKVLYLCPTRQLANQVGNKSLEYGIHSHVLIGKKKEYPPAKVSDWNSCNNIVVSTYSSLFNVNPKLNNPDIIILDDAHAAENYLANFWSLSIQRNKHNKLYKDLINLFKRDLSENIYHIASNDDIDPFTRQTTDLLPQPYLLDQLEQVIEIFEHYFKENENDELRFSWSFLKENLKNLQVYFSWSEILFRPWIVPSLTFSPFSTAKLRIYMSATFGSSGDLERMIGISKIHRIHPPAGWERQSTGRRLFIFPNRNFDEEISRNWLIKIFNRIDRGLVISPNTMLSDKINNVIATAQKQILSSSDIEESLENFTNLENAILSLKGRYDGIDLPGEKCRYLFIHELPKGLNLQEQFFWNKLNLRKIFLNERIRTRITQASGRCTRNQTDYAVIIIIGQELLDFLHLEENRNYLHPELRAEIEFGLENSNVPKTENLDELIDIFLNDKKSWNEADQDIIKRRNSRTKLLEENHKVIEDITTLEIDYQYNIWKQNYEKALDIAVKITDKISQREFDAFRSIWYYHSGCSAIHLNKLGSDRKFLNLAEEKFQRASICNKSITWFNKLIYRVNPNKEKSSFDEFSKHTIYNKIGDYIEKLGFTGHKFNKVFEQIKANILNITDASSFDSGLLELGKLLGFDSFKPDGHASPDVVWRYLYDYLIIFETKLNTNKSESITVTSCRQALSHLKWMENRMPLYLSKKNYTVVVSTRESISNSALPICEDLFYLHTSDISKLFDKLYKIYTELRSQLDGLDITDRDEKVQKVLESNALSPINVVEQIIKYKIKELPVSN